MNIYFAAAWGRRAEIQGYAMEARAIGHVVTSTWLILPPDAEHIPANNLVAGYAGVRCLDDLTGSDLLVLFTEHPGSTTNAHGGRHWEAGYALARNIPIWIVGPRENLFCYHPHIRTFKTWFYAAAALQQEMLSCTSPPAQAR